MRHSRFIATAARCFAMALALATPASAIAAGPPTIPAAWVTGVTTTSAVLRAQVNPQGSSTKYHFEYLTLAAYEANLAAARDAFAGAASAPSTPVFLGAGATPIAVSFTLTGPLNALLPGTAYRYRVVASNEAGTATASRQLRTESSGAPTGLPDGRAWELVSPVDKGGGAVAPPGALFGGGEIQAAGGGGALAYGSATAFAEPQSAPPVSQYLSRRGDGGWSTANVSLPLDAGGYGDHPDGAPFRLFSTDLGRGLVLDGRRCAVEGTCPPSYSLWEESGAVRGLPSAPGLRFEGASADLGRLVVGADSGLFEWGAGGMEAISADSGAALAAPVGAISSNGSRIYFTAPPAGSIYLHEDGSGARLLPATTGAGTAFQAASTDGGVAYFTRAGTLYRYVGATEASDPIATGVVGVLAVSADGARVYYQDGAGLQIWDEGSVREIAAGAGVALASDYPPAVATARLSTDGTVLAFLSDAPLGGFDSVDAETGALDVEVYLYDAGNDALLCASCNPTGERPSGSASIPGALVNGTTAAYRPRALAADGRRLFFDSDDALVPRDTDARADVYQWEASGEGSCAEAPGCVSLISGGRGEGGRFLDASADGADVFFLTGDSLVGADPGSIDVYDARVGGGLPEPASPIPCVGDACQPLPSPPDDPAAGSALSGPGNPAPRYQKEGRRPRKHHHHKRRHHHRGERRAAR